MPISILENWLSENKFFYFIYERSWNLGWIEWTSKVAMKENHLGDPYNESGALVFMCIFGHSKLNLKNVNNKHIYFTQQQQ